MHQDIALLEAISDQDIKEISENIKEDQHIYKQYKIKQNK